MTILHTETLKHWGGQQNRVLSEVTGLIKRGHRVIIACRIGSLLAQKARAAGVTVYEVNMVKRAHLVTIPQMINIIRKEGVDLVCTHSSVDSWTGGIAAKLAGRRLIRFRHNLYLIGRDPLTRFIYALPDRIIAISHAVKDVIAGCGIKTNKINIILDSVDSAIFNQNEEGLRKELGIAPETMVIGNTSGFIGLKGQKYLLEAFNSIHDKYPCVLLLAGNLVEPFRSRYLSHVREDLRDKVIMLGHRDDIPRVLRTIDVFVYPSYLEGLGTALLEAMTVGLPVAVSDIPTFRHFIEDSVNGVYFRAKNAGSLADTVLSLMANKDLRVQMGKNARATALDMFSRDRMIDVTEDLYREVMNAS